MAAPTPAALEAAALEAETARLAAAIAAASPPPVSPDVATLQAEVAALRAALADATAARAEAPRPPRPQRADATFVSAVFADEGAKSKKFGEQQGIVRFDVQAWWQAVQATVNPGVSPNTPAQDAILLVHLGLTADVREQVTASMGGTPFASPEALHAALLQRYPAPTRLLQLADRYFAAPKLHANDLGALDHYLLAVDRWEADFAAAERATLARRLVDHAEFRPELTPEARLAEATALMEMAGAGGVPTALRKAHLRHRLPKATAATLATQEGAPFNDDVPMATTVRAARQLVEAGV